MQRTIDRQDEHNETQPCTASPHQQTVTPTNTCAKMSITNDLDNDEQMNSEYSDVNY